MWERSKRRSSVSDKETEKKPEAQADIGVVIFSATDGSVIKADLHPNKVD